MKVKQRPEDFVVIEQTDLIAGEAGSFALYRLNKVGWTTPDALAVIRRRWNLQPQRVSYGGLKDRHAETTQYLTIYRGPTRNLEHQRLKLEYLGQVSQPFMAEQIRANRFQICLRGLTSEQVVRALGEIPSLSREGVANYFDDQRFGSVTVDRQFVAREMVRGEYEQAVKLALAAPYEHDRAEDKQIKSILREHWGNWTACKAALPKCSARSIVDYLVHHPTSFRAAFARMRPELTSLYLSAYQSYLWNEMLAQWLQTTLDSADLTRLPLKLGPLPTPRRVPDAVRAIWETAHFPYPSSRLKKPSQSSWLAPLEAVLQQEGLELETLRIRGLDKPYFSRGDRAICLKPTALTATEDSDELNPGRRILRLEFELPRGAYATMIIKRLAQSE